MNISTLLVGLSLPHKPYRYYCRVKFDTELTLYKSINRFLNAFISSFNNGHLNTHLNKFNNLNTLLIRRHDLPIKNDDYLELQESLMLEGDKSPIDFSKRILTRIFSNGRFDHGGRFYRAWWHNVPKEYRKYITIDGKRTCEYDYSQLGPTHGLFLKGQKDG